MRILYNKRMPIRSQVSRLIELWRRYEHWLGVGALSIGFVFDLWVAKKPDSVVDNILLLSYLFIAASIIVLLNMRARRKMEEEHPAEPLILLLILQFCFGGLASNLTVLYGKSGTLGGSAVFIALLVCLVFGNEFLRSRYSQLRFNIGVYYFLLLTYCVISVPTFIFHSISDFVFLASVLLSLVIISFYLAILFVAVFRRSIRPLRQAAALVAAIAGVFVLFYFLNILPPVPLSLKDIGIYHSILKDSNGNYVALYEPAPWWELWRDTSATFTYAPGQSAYCFSSVYAPADLNTPIYQRFEHYDENTKSWQTVARVAYPISGGRADGYRGYSATAALSPGAWRCDIENSTGALIGRISFTATPGVASNIQTANL